MLKQSKENMLFLQLETRGISNDKILSSFLSIDREDFVPLQFKRSQYHDIEIKNNDRIMLRCYVLGKIIDYCLNRNSKNILIVGDSTGYTTSIFHNIFDNGMLATIYFSELSEIRSRVQNIHVMQFENILSNHKNKFDVIFFDGGFYKKSIIKDFVNIMDENGVIIYFSKKITYDFSEKQFDFINVLVETLTKTSENTLFEMPMLFPNKFII